MGESGTLRSVIATPFGDPAAEVLLTEAPLIFVVAQAKFERVASIFSEEFIAPFQEAIRATYPKMQREQQAGIAFGPEGLMLTPDAGPLWRFDERPDGWQVVLAPDFVAISTTRYTSRRDLIERFATVVETAQQRLGVRFCERLGVRYVDRITDTRLLDQLSGLLRPEVLGAVGVDLGEPGAVQVHAFADSTYRLPEATEVHARWGLLPAGATFDPSIEAADEPSWVLDVDAYSIDQQPFEPPALTARAEALCGRVYQLFRWAVQDEFLRAHGGRP